MDFAAKLEFLHEEVRVLFDAEAKHACAFGLGISR